MTDRDGVTQHQHTFHILKGVIETVRHDLWPRIEMQSFAVFLHVAVDPRIEQRTLADRVGVSESSISRNLNKLVNEGLIRREENPRDRRAKVYEMTDTGGRIMERLSRRLPEVVGGTSASSAATTGGGKAGDGHEVIEGF